MSPNDEVFVCSCRDELKTKDDVDKHEFQEYWSQRHGKQCDFPGCKDTIRQTSNAKRHWRTHLPERLGRYFCTRCGIGYAKPEALKKHEEAVDCRKNRRMCRRTFEHDAAPPASRQMTTYLPDPQVNESLPPHPEETFNDTSLPSASSTAPRAVDWPSLSPILPTFAPSRGQILRGSFTMDTSRRVQLSNAQQRKRSRSMFEEDVALAVPPITPRNSMSSPDGHATDSEPSSEVLPSNDTSSSLNAIVQSLREPHKDCPLLGLHVPPDVYPWLRHSCTQCFESQLALQRHERDFHRSQEHNDNDSGAESGAASVSPRPHARPVLISDHTPVPPDQHPKHRFTIGRSQESQLGDLRMRYAGQELPKVRVLVVGSWGSVGSLLSDLTENVRFEHRPPGPRLTSLWGAIAKATPPELLREMDEWHIYHFLVDTLVSQWVIDLEWTEEGITGHWQKVGMTLTALKRPEGTARRIIVSTL